MTDVYALRNMMEGEQADFAEMSRGLTPFSEDRQDVRRPLGIERKIPAERGFRAKPSAWPSTVVPAPCRT